VAMVVEKKGWKIIDSPKERPFSPRLGRQWRASG